MSDSDSYTDDFDDGDSFSSLSSLESEGKKKKKGAKKDGQKASERPPEKVKASVLGFGGKSYRVELDSTQDVEAFVTALEKAGLDAPRSTWKLMCNGKEVTDNKATLKAAGITSLSFMCLERKGGVDVLDEAAAKAAAVREATKGDDQVKDAAATEIAKEAATELAKETATKETVKEVPKEMAKVAKETVKEVPKEMAKETTVEVAAGQKPPLELLVTVVAAAALAAVYRIRRRPPPAEVLGGVFRRLHSRREVVLRALKATIKHSVLVPQQHCPREPAVPASPPSLSADGLHKLYDALRIGELPPSDDVVALLVEATQRFSSMPNVVHLTVPTGGVVVVAGALHGDLHSFRAILEEAKDEPEAVFVVNGGFASGSSDGLALVLLVLTLSLLAPHHFYATRGCTESSTDLARSAAGHYGGQIANLLIHTLLHLPLVLVIDKTLAVLHGGLPPVPPDLADIDSIVRHRIPLFPPAGSADMLLHAVLHASPRDLPPGETFRDSDFGAPVTERFLKKTGLQGIACSHKALDGGFEDVHHGMVTVFTSGLTPFSPVPVLLRILPRGKVDLSYVPVTSTPPLSETVKQAVQVLAWRCRAGAARSVPLWRTLADVVDVERRVRYRCPLEKRWVAEWLPRALRWVRVDGRDALLLVKQWVGLPTTTAQLLAGEEGGNESAYTALWCTKQDSVRWASLRAACGGSTSVENFVEHVMRESVVSLPRRKWQRMALALSPNGVVEWRSLWSAVAEVDRDLRIDPLRMAHAFEALASSGSEVFAALLPLAKPALDRDDIVAAVASHMPHPPQSLDIQRDDLARLVISLHPTSFTFAKLVDLLTPVDTLPCPRAVYPIARRRWALFPNWHRVAVIAAVGIVMGSTSTWEAPDRLAHIADGPRGGPPLTKQESGTRVVPLRTSTPRAQPPPQHEAVQFEGADGFTLRTATRHCIVSFPDGTDSAVTAVEYRGGRLRLTSDSGKQWVPLPSTPTPAAVLYKMKLLCDISNVPHNFDSQVVNKAGEVVENGPGMYLISEAASRVLAVGEKAARVSLEGVASREALSRVLTKVGVRGRDLHPLLCLLGCGGTLFPPPVQPYWLRFLLLPCTPSGSSQPSPRRRKPLEKEEPVSPTLDDVKHTLHGLAYVADESSLHMLESALAAAEVVKPCKTALDCQVNQLVTTDGKRIGKVVGFQGRHAVVRYPEGEELVSSDLKLVDTARKLEALDELGYVEYRRTKLGVKRSSDHFVLGAGCCATALHFACLAGRLPTVRWLLEQGSSPILHAGGVPNGPTPAQICLKNAAYLKQDEGGGSNVSADLSEARGRLAEVGKELAALQQKLEDVSKRAISATGEAKSDLDRQQKDLERDVSAKEEEEAKLAAKRDSLVAAQALKEKMKEANADAATALKRMAGLLNKYSRRRPSGVGKSFPALTHVSKEGRRHPVKDSFAVLCDAVRENRVLTTLNLGGKRLDLAKATQLCEALQANTTVTELNLRSCGLSDESGILVAKLLAVNTTLSSLYLWHNDLGDDAGLAVVESAQRNTSLAELDLSCTKMTEKGMKDASRKCAESGILLTI